MLEQNGLRLLKLIDDLLDLVRFDTGHADINRQPTLIAAHIEGLLRSLRHLAEQDRVALLWDCKTDSDAIQLDRDKFDKILLNLVINAIKFTPSERHHRGEGQRRGRQPACLTVEDTGVGIPPEVLPRIFERFWQVDTSSTRKFQGAGHRPGAGPQPHRGDGRRGQGGQPARPWHDLHHRHCPPRPPPWRSPTQIGRRTIRSRTAETSPTSTAGRPCPFPGKMAATSRHPDPVRPARSPPR